MVPTGLALVARLTSQRPRKAFMTRTLAYGMEDEQSIAENVGGEHKTSTALRPSQQSGDSGREQFSTFLEQLPPISLRELRKAIDILLQSSKFMFHVRRLWTPEKQSFLILGALC